MKITQEELVVRLLWSLQTWVKSYELSKRDTEWGWLGSAAERRAREIAERGYFDSNTYRYVAEYRCVKRELRPDKQRVVYAVADGRTLAVIK